MTAAQCSIEDCLKLVHARGLCPMHYQRDRLFGDPFVASGGPRKPRVRRVGVEPCSIDGCDKVQKARTWCVAHWTRWQRYGSPTHRLPGDVVDGKRVCPGCNVDKPLRDYTPGSTGRCRRCVADRRSEWRAANPDAMRASNASRDPSRLRAAATAWRAANPEKVRDQAALRRARKAEATIERFSYREIFERDAWVCGICQKAVDSLLKYPHPESVSLDHVIPLSRGGAHSRANAQASHLICNVRKHASRGVVSA